MKGAIDMTNTELVRAGFAAQEQGDLEPIRALFEPTAPIHVPDFIPLPELRGLDGMIALVTEMTSSANGGFRSHLLEAIGAGDLVTTINAVTSTRGTTTIAYNNVWTFRLHSGKIAEAWLHPSLPSEQVANFYGWAA
jgi:ketosteroid isomerase-like protein